MVLSLLIQSFYNFVLFYLLYIKGWSIQLDRWMVDLYYLSNNQLSYYSFGFDYNYLAITHLHFIQSLNLYLLAFPIDFCINGSPKKKLSALPSLVEIDLVCVWLSNEIRNALISRHLGCRRRSFHFSRIFLRTCCPCNTLLSLSRAKSREVIISRGGMHQGKERVGGV